MYESRYNLAMFKQFMLKKLINAQMSKVPEEMRPMVANLVEKHPDLLMKLAEDFQAEVKSGKSQEDAFMAVAQKHQAELKKLQQ